MKRQAPPRLMILATFRLLTYHVSRCFRDGRDDPRAISNAASMRSQRGRPSSRRGWCSMKRAHTAADASAARWREGKLLSPIDGMPIAIKDLIETKDMPTQMGCAALEGNFPKRDSALVRAPAQRRDDRRKSDGPRARRRASHVRQRTRSDPQRTPGGLSAGSAAAIGAAMTGRDRHPGGRLGDPSASYCANWALKVTFGALQSR